MNKTNGCRRGIGHVRALLLSLAALTLSAPALAGIGDGGCAWLSGSTYLDSSAIASPTGAFTVEAWARCDSSDPASQFIVSKNDDDGSTTRNGYYLRVNASGYAEAGIGDGSKWVTVASTFDIDQGEWNHYALVYDGTNLSFYLNGVPIGSTTVTPSHSSANFTVGRGQYAVSYAYWTGHIDEVRYWSEARTQAEICDGMFTSFTDAICNLLLYYKFDGDAKDASRPEDLSGTGTFVSGGSGVCQSYVTLNGSTEYFSSSSILFPSKAFTVEAWARCASESPADQYIVSQNEDDPSFSSGYYIRVNADGKAEAGISDGFSWATVASADSILQNAWNHYALTFDGTYLEFYLNGSSVGYTSAAPLGNTVNFMVGRGQYHDGDSSDYYFWNGDIEEVRCWSVERTQTEISNNMNTTLVGTECGLQHYYKFDGDGSDSVETAQDLTWSATGEYRRSGAFAGPKNALVLDGSEDYIQVADDPSLDFSTGSFTLMFWIKGAVPAADRAVIDHTDGSGGYLVEATDSGKIRFPDTDLTLTSDATVMDGTWRHVTVTQNSGAVSLYVDGILDATADGFYAACTASASNPLYVGRYQSGATPCLDAALDEVRIWNYNLDDFSPIETIPGCLFRNLVATDYGLVLYFRMDFGTAGQDNSALGTRLADHSGAGNPGTLSYTSSYPVFGASTAFYTWLGAESGAGTPPASSRWDRPGNWSRYAVPAGTDNVGLHKSPGYSPSDSQPRLNSTTGDRACNHLHVGENFYLDDSAKISVSGHFFGTSQAPFACATGTLAFVGSSRQCFIWETSAYNLDLDNSASADLVLVSLYPPGTFEILDGGTVTVTRGDIDLNGNIIKFQGSGTLIESPGCTVKGTDGSIEATYTQTGAKEDIAGLGLDLSSVVPVGGFPITFTVTRRHAPEVGAFSREGILRSYDVFPDQACTATVTFNYDASELNDCDDADLRLFLSTAPDTWNGYAEPSGKGTGYLVQDAIAFAADSSTRLTLADKDAPLLVDLAWFTATPALPLGVVVRWETLSELDNLGFYVRRAETADGPWERLNAVIIPARGNEVTGAAYEWVDDAVGPARTWWYRLEDVDSYGVSTLHPPVPVLIPSPAPDDPPRPPTQN